MDERIGFIGIGIMGGRMAGRLLAAGYRLHVTTRSPDKARDLLAAGAVWYDTPRAVAAACPTVITMVGGPDDLEAVYFGPDGMIAAAAAGAVMIDMSTSRPTLARRIAAAAAVRGAAAADAPVSGGDVGAAAGTLSIMVGCSPEVFARIRPVLEHLGSEVVRHGEPGAGQHAKMCNQIAVASAIMGVCESLSYARLAGLDPAIVLRSVGAGTGGGALFQRLGPKIVAGDLAPGFYVRHMIKDLGLALEAAAELGLELPAVALARRLYERVSQAGHGELGTQALIKAYQTEEETTR